MNRETNVTNFARTELSAEMGSSATIANVDSTAGFPTSPAILVIEPDSVTRREVILFDGSFTASSFSTSSTANRYLDGSAAGSGITHPARSVVFCAPLSQHLNDTNDRIDVAETDIATKLTRDGLSTLSVGTATPSAPATNDLWVDTA